MNKQGANLHYFGHRLVNCPYIRRPSGSGTRKGHSPESLGAIALQPNISFERTGEAKKSVTRPMTGISSAATATAHTASAGRLSPTPDPVEGEMAALVGPRRRQTAYIAF